MTINDIVRRLPVSIELATFGGKSSFLVVNRGEIVVITNSSGSQLRLDAAYVNLVYNRYISLTTRKRFMASEYVDPKWPIPSNPNRIFSPYVARIIAYLS
jgi:hypothetical protein